MEISFAAPRAEPRADARPHHRDFRSAVRKCYTLPVNEQSEDIAEQEEFTKHITNVRPKSYKYAIAAPLTPAEIKTARERGLGPEASKSELDDAFTCRYRRKLGSIPQLWCIPEIELALHAMLFCSLGSGRSKSDPLYGCHKCVMEYWTAMLTIFPRCVQEIAVSQCPEVGRYRVRAKEEPKNPKFLTPICLIPSCDVNHPLSKFYAYAHVWRLFARIFGDDYKEMPSFYFERSDEAAADDDDDDDDDDSDNDGDFGPADEEVEEEEEEEDGDEDEGEGGEGEEVKKKEHEEEGDGEEEKEEDEETLEYKGLHEEIVDKEEEVTETLTAKQLAEERLKRERAIQEKSAAAIEETIRTKATLADAEFQHRVAELLNETRITKSIADSDVELTKCQTKEDDMLKNMDEKRKEQISGYVTDPDKIPRNDYEALAYYDNIEDKTMYVGTKIRDNIFRDNRQKLQDKASQYAKAMTTLRGDEITKRRQAEEAAIEAQRVKKQYEEHLSLKRIELLAVNPVALRNAFQQRQDACQAATDEIFCTRRAMVEPVIAMDILSEMLLSHARKQLFILSHNRKEELPRTNNKSDWMSSGSYTKVDTNNLFLNRSQMANLGQFCNDNNISTNIFFEHHKLKDLDKKEQYDKVKNFLLSHLCSYFWKETYANPNFTPRLTCNGRKGDTELAHFDPLVANSWSVQETSIPDILTAYSTYLQNICFFNQVDSTSKFETDDADQKCGICGDGAYDHNDIQNEKYHAEFLKWSEDNEAKRTEDNLARLRQRREYRELHGPDATQPEYPKYTDIPNRPREPTPLSQPLSVPRMSGQLCKLNCTCKNYFHPHCIFNEFNKKIDRRHGNGNFRDLLLSCPGCKTEFRDRLWPYEEEFVVSDADITEMKFPPEKFIQVTMEKREHTTARLQRVEYMPAPEAVLEAVVPVFGTNADFKVAALGRELIFPSM